MSIASPTRIGKVPDEILYPSHDDVPMAETQLHIRAIILLFQALEDFLATKLDMFLAADMFWYWEEGNPKARSAPDIMVIKGIGRAIRRSILSWKEGGAVPAVIFEMASQSTWRENLNGKKQLFERHGVREYFVFDPEAKYLRPALQGFRLDTHGKFKPIVPEKDGRLFCQELGCYLQVESDVLRVIDAATGKPVLFRSEQIEEMKQQAAKDKKLARLEKKRADEQKQLAKMESKRADALEREVARLKALTKNKGESHGV